jgi:hypothetical protein
MMAKPLPVTSTTARKINIGILSCAERTESHDAFLSPQAYLTVGRYTNLPFRECRCEVCFEVCRVIEQGQYARARSQAAETMRSRDRER